MNSLLQRLTSCLGYACAYFLSFPLPPAFFFQPLHAPHEPSGNDSPESDGCSTLSHTIQSQLIAKVHAFMKFHGKASNAYSFVFVEDPGDWSLRTHGTRVEFNATLALKCTLPYLESILIHETFHLMNGLPTNREAKLLRSLYHDVSLRAIDIEADVETYRFLSHHDGMSFMQFSLLLYEGLSVYREDKAFPAKVERWWGTMVSAYYYSLMGSKMVLVPVFTAVPLDATLYFLAICGESISLLAVYFTTESLECIYELYQQGDKHPFERYHITLLEVLDSVIAQILESRKPLDA